MRKLTGLVMLIFFISLASALELSPNQIQVNGYPGETFTSNLTITCDWNCAVYLYVNSTANITASYNSTSPLVVERQRTVQVFFHIPTNIIPGVYDINLSASTEYSYTEALVRGNSGSTIHHGERIIYKDNTQNVTVPNITEENRLRELINELNNQTIILDNEDKSSKTILWIWGIALLIFIGLIIGLIKIWRKNE